MSLSQIVLVYLTSVAWLVGDRATRAFWLSRAELLKQVKGGDRPAAEGLLSTGPELSRDRS